MVSIDLSAVGLAAFMWGFAALLLVYGMVAPVSQTDDNRLDTREEDAWAIDYERDVDAREPDALMDKFVRPMLRNFIPQTPMAAQVKGSRRQRLLALLISAGNPWRLSPEEFVGLMWLGGLGGALVGVLVGAVLGIPPFITGAVLAVIGAFLPRYWYRRSRSVRIDEANRSLPEGIDLLRIVMVSGQKFQSAMVEVSRRLPDGLIKVEFTRISDDLRSGRSLDRSLTDFAIRVPAESVESFTRAIIQGERLGASITDTLASQSESIRHGYESRIDKAIATLETTIFLPILIGLVPAIFIIIAAPALTAIVNFL